MGLVAVHLRGGNIEDEAKSALWRYGIAILPIKEREECVVIAEFYINCPFLLVLDANGVQGGSTFFHFQCVSFQIIRNDAQRMHKKGCRKEKENAKSGESCHESAKRDVKNVEKGIKIL